MDIKGISSKKNLRLENKRKKLVALVDLIRLNDKDKKMMNSKSEEPMRKKLKTGDSKESENSLNPSTSEIDHYNQLKQEVARRLQKNIPRLTLKMQGELALLKTEMAERVPIFLTDIQYLLSNTLIGHSVVGFSPSRWLNLERSNKISHTIVLIIEGVSLYHFSSLNSLFIESSKHFKNQLEIMLPRLADKIVEELIAVPLTSNQLEFLIEYYGSLDSALKSTTNPMWLVKSIFPIEGINHLNSDEKKITLPKSDEYPRTHLLLSPLQMVDAFYPLPLRGLSNKYRDYVPTQDEYKEVTPSSPMFGLDCEMCMTQNYVPALTRITIVDENYKVVYETLVLPDKKIENYMTKYSGITSEMLQGVTKTLKDVQKDVRNILPKDAILVGHSLNADLDAMQMMHPYVIDTSIVYNRTGERHKKTKLQYLVKEFFNETIQSDKRGHDSTEDSIYTLKLAQLKLRKNLEFGDVLLTNRRRAAHLYKDLSNEEIKKSMDKELTSSMLHQFERKDRTTTIINTSNIDYQKYVNEKKMDKEQKANFNITCIKEFKNKKAVKKTCEVALQNALTLTHIVIPPSKLEESEINKTLTKVDGWISKIHEAGAANSLLIVILAGTSEKSGVALVKIKN